MHYFHVFVTQLRNSYNGGLVYSRPPSLKCFHRYRTRSFDRCNLFPIYCQLCPYFFSSRITLFRSFLEKLKLQKTTAFIPQVLTRKPILKNSLHSSEVINEMSPQSIKDTGHYWQLSKTSLLT